MCVHVRCTRTPAGHTVHHYSGHALHLRPQNPTPPPLRWMAQLLTTTPALNPTVLNLRPLNPTPPPEVDGPAAHHYPSPKPYSAEPVPPKPYPPP